MGAELRVGPAAVANPLVATPAQAQVRDLNSIFRLAVSQLQGVRDRLPRTLKDRLVQYLEGGIFFRILRIKGREEQTAELRLKHAQLLATTEIDTTGLTLDQLRILILIAKADPQKDFNQNELLLPGGIEALLSMGFSIESLIDLDPVALQFIVSHTTLINSILSLGLTREDLLNIPPHDIQKLADPTFKNLVEARVVDVRIFKFYPNFFNTPRWELLRRQEELFTELGPYSQRFIQEHGPWFIYEHGELLHDWFKGMLYFARPEDRDMVKLDFIRQKRKMLKGLPVLSNAVMQRYTGNHTVTRLGVMKALFRAAKLKSERSRWVPAFADNSIYDFSRETIELMPKR